MSAITTTIAEAASANGVPPSLALAQASAESGLNPSAYNPKSGAMGLFQLMPGTASDMGVTNPWDPAQSAYGGTAYLAQLYSRFGDWEMALAAYDWGPTNVAKAQAAYGANWLAHAPAETQDYVDSILGNAGLSSQPAAQSPASLPDVPPADSSSFGSGDSLMPTSLAPETSWLWTALGLAAAGVALVAVAQ